MIVTDEEYLTPDEIARKLRVKPETIMQWLRQRKLAGYKVGGLWRISKRDYAKFLKDNYNIEEGE
jgi:excisionase family DNA binding protein